MLLLRPKAGADTYPRQAPSSALVGTAAAGAAGETTPAMPNAAGGGGRPAMLCMTQVTMCRVVRVRRCGGACAAPQAGWLQECALVCLQYVCWQARSSCLSAPHNPAPHLSDSATWNPSALNTVLDQDLSRHGSNTDTLLDRNIIDFASRQGDQNEIKTTVCDCGVGGNMRVNPTHFLIIRTAERKAPPALGVGRCAISAGKRVAA